MMNPYKFGGDEVVFEKETIAEASFFVNLGPVRLGLLMARYPSREKPSLRRS
jgi:hypothetical protein